MHELGGGLRVEQHFDGRRMLCFSQRPPTLAAMFADLVRRVPDRPAIVDDTTVSYRDLVETVAAIASDLAVRGVGSGDRLALLLGNCREFLTCTLACATLGVIVVPIGIRHLRAEVEFLLGDCANHLLYPGSHYLYALCDAP